MSGAVSTSGPESLDDDISPRFTPRQALAESSRCLFCYDAPCVRACPTGIDIPGFIRRIANGHATGAAHTIMEENIFGGTCARVCPTEVLCEEKCVMNEGEQRPISIGRLQRFATDALMEEAAATKAPHPFTRAPSTGKKVAVVGAGPASLSAAHRLAMLGHEVAVFEAKPKAGGLNEYGIAAYKMVNDFARKEAKFILGIGGIKIHYGKALGRGVKLHELSVKYDAVFIGVGLGNTRDLSIAGEQLKGVGDAVDFIERLRQRKTLGAPKVGKRVVVIGGGNTAIDAAIQSKLLGADEVVMAYRRGPEQMSATGYEQQLAKSSGVVVRDWLAPKKIKGPSKGKDAGKVTAVEFVRTKLDAKGKLVETKETVTIACDMVLKAVGQTMIEETLAGLELKNGKIAVNKDFATSLKGIFAGGDCVKSGEDLTVQAVQDGKLAAHAIDRFLKG
ncbi:MAG TPA: NAD(P)-dependent oxidoreductase [Magnetospirillaceae bacterium]|jgi:glutamate synthase (NADPH/NADH) small chain